MKFKVYCGECNCQHDVAQVDFENIEEDIQGRDVVTFRCRTAGEDAPMQTSYVFAG